jgi:hypothetical protein
MHDPSRHSRQACYRDDIGSNLGWRQMLDTRGRDIVHAKKLGGLDPAVFGNYSIRTINQDWIDKSKFLDAGGNLLDLFFGVRTRVCGPRL